MKTSKTNGAKAPVFSASFMNFIEANADNSKVCRLITNAARISGNIINLVLTNREVNYLTFRGNGMISYMPAGKTQLFNDFGDWCREGRQEGKPAKIMRKIFTATALKTLKDSDFEVFSNKFRAQNQDNFVFRLRDKEDIAEVYDMDRYKGESSLSSSCMNEKGCEGYLEIYSYVPDLKILTLETTDGNQLAGRALVWGLSVEGFGAITFCDRIYVAEDYMYEMFLDEIDKRGWWCKKDYKAHSNKTKWVAPDGSCHYVNAKVELEYSECELYPYIDTFSYGDDDCLYNHDIEVYTYDNTNGSRTEKGVYDDIDCCYIDEDDAVTIDRGTYRNYTTHMRNTVVSVDDEIWYYEDNELVEINGEYYPKDHADIVFVESDNKYYHIKDCVYSEKEGEWFLASDCVYSEYSNSYIPEWKSCKCGNAYYHEDEVEFLG